MFLSIELLTNARVPFIFDIAMCTAHCSYAIVLYIFDIAMCTARCSQAGAEQTGRRPELF